MHFFSLLQGEEVDQLCERVAVETLAPGLLIPNTLLLTMKREGYIEPALSASISDLLQKESEDMAQSKLNQYGVSGIFSN